ncbi:hypothetical protein H4O18_07575 [Arenibacter sp. BSSL-BM3]|uniref:PrcB C-terminal n=1 Tax=Arenibacter arenosicollis TaxID=2762274 RepID=A0ABR7QKX6_9FLAO|nr:hypothetical protein [Arenibacter arenosicollis]MBC8767846.1 hypothetical protein [Arenibacter arenosicollis]
MRLLLLIICLFGTACVGQKAVSGTMDDSSEQDSRNLQLVLGDNYSGVEQLEFQVVRDPKTLKNLFLQINKTRKPGLPIPEVDFTEELLLVYCAGTGLGEGRLKLVVIEESPEKITMGLKERITTKKENLNVATTPIYIYKMPVTHKEISFQ